MQAARDTIAPRPTHINSLVGWSSGSSRRAAGAARVHPVAGPSAEKSSGKKRAATFDYKAAARQRLGWGAAGGGAVDAVQRPAEAADGDVFDNDDALRDGGQHDGARLALIRSGEARRAEQPTQR